MRITRVEDAGGEWCGGEDVCIVSIGAPHADAKLYAMRCANLSPLSRHENSFMGIKLVVSLCGCHGDNREQRCLGQ